MKQIAAGIVRKAVAFLFALSILPKPAVSFLSEYPLSGDRLTGLQAAESVPRSEQQAPVSPIAFSLCGRGQDDILRSDMFRNGLGLPDFSLAGGSRAPAEQKPRKRPGVAIAEVVGINVFVWAVEHYVFDLNWTYLSLDTISDNLKYWFEWDPNYFKTNFYHHPYHGSFYFNAGRANGLDYWGSALCAFGGSLMWETMMERYRPSINDLIMTTTGGMFLGEVTHRFSARVRAGRARGLDRVWREVLGAILDPVGGLNRLLTKGKSDDPLVTEEVPVHGQLTWAGALIIRNREMEGTKAVPILIFDLEYGEPFQDGRPREPLDYFPLQGQLRFGPDRLHLSLNAFGLLAGKDIGPRRGAKHLVGLFQNFDYISFEALRLGGSSICGGVRSLFRLSKNVDLTTFFQAGWLALGAGNNDYIEVKNRNYNYGTGWVVKTEASLGLSGFDFLQVRWRQYGIHCIEGARGTDIWNVVIGQINLPVWRTWGVGLQYSQYFRDSRYRDFPDVKQRLYEARAFVSIQF